MRLALVLATVCAAVLATPVEEHHVTDKVADTAFLEKQKSILGLFSYINQPTHYKTYVEIANSYNPEDHVDHFEKPEHVKEFFHYYHHEVLERDEIFSVFNNVHIKQAIALFKVFYHAKDWDTFYKTAVWARQHVNQGMFLYSFSVAIVHRPDTFGIVLPPIYEIYPYYFFDDEVITKAQKYKQMHHVGDGHNDEEHPYVIWANYSGHYLNLHPDQSMSYYLEDVGINAFYYYFHIFQPYWMHGKDYGIEHEHRGELFYFLHQQLLARYYLERISSKWGEIPYFNWEVPFESGYYPSLRYPNGLQFPERPNFAKLQEHFYNYGQRWTFKQPYGYSYEAVRAIERRIVDAILLGYVFDVHGEKVDIYTEEGMNIIGNMIEGNADSVHHRYYGGYDKEHDEYHSGYVHFARHLLGYAPQPLCYHQTQPSALEHYETSLRDPAFYQFYKKVVIFFQMYKYNLPPYTSKDLHFDGVKVTEVEMERLITYFDHFDSDITNAVYVDEKEFENHHFRIYARQERLNHKPYTYKVHVHSDKDVKAVVRVYMGPKHDEYGRPIHLNENRVNFVQLDYFTHDLKAGENVIVRNSYENHYLHNDKTSYKDLYKKVLSAIEGQEKFYVGGMNGEEFYYGFPHRYMLPKGTHEGIEYQFYFVVSPYVEYHHPQTEHHSGHTYHYDGYALGFPFDRRLVDHDFYDAPNIYGYTTKIYHRSVHDINASTADH